MAAVQPISAVGRDEQAEDQQAGLLAQPLKKQEEGAASITEMVKDVLGHIRANRQVREWGCSTIYEVSVR